MVTDLEAHEFFYQLFKTGKQEIALRKVRTATIMEMRTHIRTPINSALLIVQPTIKPPRVFTPDQIRQHMLRKDRIGRRHIKIMKNYIRFLETGEYPK